MQKDSYKRLARGQSVLPSTRKLFKENRPKIKDITTSQILLLLHNSRNRGLVRSLHSNIVKRVNVFRVQGLNPQPPITKFLKMFDGKRKRKRTCRDKEQTCIEYVSERFVAQRMNLICEGARRHHKSGVVFGSAMLITCYQMLQSMELHIIIFSISSPTS